MRQAGDRVWGQTRPEWRKERRHSVEEKRWGGDEQELVEGESEELRWRSNLGSKERDLREKEKETRGEKRGQSV